jgi:hypothetical protein
VVIDGKTFWHDQRDLIVWAKDGVCTSGVGATKTALGIDVHFLGDAFLKNVVSIFDFGKNEMRFAARVDEGKSTGSGGEIPVSSDGLRSFRVEGFCIRGVVGFLIFCRPLINFW